MSQAASANAVASLSGDALVQQALAGEKDVADSLLHMLKSSSVPVKVTTLLQASLPRMPPKSNVLCPAYACC